MDKATKDKLLQDAPNFIVINTKHLKKVPCGMVRTIYEVLESIPENNYYVCNTDEPYADEVLDIILKGEEKK